MDDTTLAYLTNPVYFSELAKRSDTSERVADDEVVFYRRRLISLYKDLLGGEKVNDSLDEAHRHFVRLAIAHFQRLDREAVLQKEYEELCDDEIPLPPHDQEPPNHDELLMTTKEVAVPTLENFVTSTKPPMPNTPPPQRRIVNLKDEHFRDKGVPKKRVSIHEV